MPKFTIGTRGSLLAVTQCTLAKNELEQNTQDSFELKTIKTQGDQITDKPLWQLEGKDFFTKELDAALLKQEVDLVVHSYKDLGSDRPQGIELACITQRKFANDILLIDKKTIENLDQVEEFHVGTSSPRRIANLTDKLADYLPLLDSGKKRNVVCDMLRGNVNTRIQKLRDKKYHAIVLAMAGLERLASYPESAKELKNLLAGLNYFILPLKDFPAAAAQGALAIEVASDTTIKDGLKRTLDTIKDENTSACMQIERERFQSYGGGCHLAVGITCLKIQDQMLVIEKGEVDGQKIYRKDLIHQDYTSVANKTSYAIMGDKDLLIKRADLDNVKIPKDAHLLISSARTFSAIKDYNQARLWSGGNRTARKLMQKGLWVNGSSEGLGVDLVASYQSSELVKLFDSQLRSPYTASFLGAENSLGKLIPCYDQVIDLTQMEELKSRLAKAEIIFWGSFTQFKKYTEYLPELATKKHACGLGKTYKLFKQNNITITPFIDYNHFREVTHEL